MKGRLLWESGVPGGLGVSRGLGVSSARGEVRLAWGLGDGFGGLLRVRLGTGWREFGSGVLGEGWGRVM